MVEKSKVVTEENIVQVSGKLCSLKNLCCQTYKCCHFCNKEGCAERCTDPCDKCIYRTDKVRVIGRPWVFNIKDNPSPKVNTKVKKGKRKEDVINNTMPKSLQLYSRKIEKYLKEDRNGTTIHTIILNDNYSTPDTNCITSQRISEIYKLLGKVKKN